MSGYEALRTGVAWLDLSARGQIRVTGDDRARLLHAMSTNNVKDLAEAQGLYTFFLSAQGRILSDALVYNLGDSLWLDTEPELRTKLREHLDKYIIADDAYLSDETNEWFTVGVEGPASLEWAQRHAIPVPSELYATVAYDDGFVAHVASVSKAGFRVFVPALGRNRLLNTLSDLPQAVADEATIVRLEDGLPRYGSEITERFLVQETGVLHAVHPNKGCYLGQEIVERVRSRAQVHRHLRTFEVPTQQLVATGTKLEVNGRDAGEIVSAMYSPAKNSVVGFAYLRTDALAGTETLTVNLPAGSATVLISDRS